MSRIPVEDHDLDDEENEGIDFDENYDAPAGEEVNNVVDQDDEQMGGIASSDQPHPNQHVVPQDQRRSHQPRQGRSDAGENPAEQEPLLDGYDRTDLIGQGAYGVVFKGVKRASGETVAIKRIPFGENNIEG